MKLKKYNDFVNESISGSSEDEFNNILNLPLEERIAFKASLEELSDMKKNEAMNEANIQNIIGDFTSWVSKKFNKWLSKKAVAWLINQNEKQLSEKINVLQMLDPTDFSDITSVKAMYLGGGIDKTSEEGAAGWRDQVEEFFGMDNVVRGEDMIKLGKKGKLDLDNYNKPLILNPLRNELVRTDDPKFGEIFRKWKSGELNQEKNPEEWKYWANIINKEIYAPDLRIVNACDTNLVKLDPAAGAGTLGEMQVTALRNMNIFLWLDNGYQVQDISPWTIPSITKLVRSDEEVKILLENIVRLNEGNN